jgi:hypothetical protein
MTGWLLLALLQGSTVVTSAVEAPPAATAAYPFGVGERFDYSAKLGFLRLGSGTIRTVSIDTVRGIPTFRFEFALEGGNALYRLNSKLESWATVADLTSLRYHSTSNENGRLRERRYEIFPDSGFYRQNGVAEPRPTPAHPLDDAAFLYFVRTTPLEIGQTYRLDYYYNKPKNPLIIRVEKRERMEMPDGTKVDCLVVQPVIGDRGIFAEKQNGRVWVTDDARRIPVQIQTRYPFGVVTLKLERVQLAPVVGAGG